MDRNVCVRDFPCGIAAQGAYFVCRQHHGLSFAAVGSERYAGQTATGKLCEQWMRVIDAEGKVRNE